jgi:2-polyprenyl-6-methoxyphenol hydroxylase-like FAD-dependent oxidoreductase
MLLARKGYKVLLVDRATFPSDTVSTHLIHPPGVAALKRWGLLDRLIASGCPPVRSYRFDFGAFSITGAPVGDGNRVAYGPRRTVMDKLLLDAADEAGVEVREGFVVEEVVSEADRITGIRGHAKGGASVTERAKVVVGADGIHSMVARAAQAGQYHERPHLQASYYSYWSGFPMDGMEGYDRGDRSWAAWPTHDGLAVVIVCWPYDQFEANKQDFERHYLAAFERAPAFRDRIRAAKREERFVGMSVPNFFRKPHGPGWALVGDAAYSKDFMTAQGMSDAFRDAESCATALDAAFSGARPFDEVMNERQESRDRHAMPMYDFTCQMASMQPPPPETKELFGAVHGNPQAMDEFVSMFAGVISPAEFFSEENIGRIFANARR